MLRRITPPRLRLRVKQIFRNPSRTSWAAATILPDMAEVARASRPFETNGRPAIDWDEALRDHDAWLRKIVRGRIGEPDAVDDLMQNVAVAALRGDRRPHDPAKVAPWLYRVAVKQCLMHRRTQGRRRRLTVQLGRSPQSGSPTDDDPLFWLLGRERRECVLAALARLPDIDRELLILKHTEHWTYQQLADRLGVSVHTIEYRLLRARKQLRSELSATWAAEVPI